MNEPTHERLDAVDEAWLASALAEVCRGEEPPDLLARVRAAAPARRAAAAATVDAAAVPVAGRWFAVAAALLGLAVVLGAFAWRGGRDGAFATQEPPAEIAVGDAAALAQLLPRVSALTLVARQDANGARLPDLPEHAAPFADDGARRLLLESLGAVAMVEAPFPLGQAQAELLLHVGTRCVRARLHFDASSTRFGTAAFGVADAMPAAAAAALRTEWLRLAAARPAPRAKMLVQTLRQLVAAIGSDRTIELAGGPFVLDARDEEGELPANEAAVFVDASPVPHLEIRGVHNLHLRAIGTPVRVLGKSFADVITFVRCRDVWCENLVLGHAADVAGACSAPVVTLDACRGVVLRDCELFGCGTEGLVAAKSEGVALEHCEVHTCRLGVVRCRDCTDVRFTGTTFRDCRIAESGFVFLDCQRVSFGDCVVRGMAGGGNGAAGDTSLFEVRMDDPVRFVRGSIRGNQCARVANSRLLLAREATDEGDNGPSVRRGLSTTDIEVVEPERVPRKK